MRIPEDCICKVCQSVFCCAQCRHKHEIKNHAIVVRKPIMMTNSVTTTTTTTTSTTIASTTIANQDAHSSSGKNIVEQASFETIYLFCPICAKQPLPLQPDIYSEMLVHVETHHLPLRCEKCAKVYYNINDLKEFTKCMRPTQLCLSQESMSTNQSCYTDDASKVTVTKALSSVHNSPLRRQDFSDSHMTPISIINMRWKAKSNKASHEEFISDSVSSIKNISSISNSSIRRSIGVASAVKGKVTRSTSTPVHLEMVFAKPKEQTFNATGCGHMSSIQYNSGCESESSPSLAHQRSSQALEPISRYRKVGGARPKMSAVTPLRQVMSKSIQKAFAEHGLPPASTAIRGGSGALQRKHMFENTASPSLDGEDGCAKKPLSPGPSALDLRLSPAVRRCQSESEGSLQLQICGEQQKPCNDMPIMQHNIVLSAKKLTTESIVITRTEHLSSVSSATSAVSSHGSSNSNNSSYISAASNSTGSSVFKSCSSVEIITATTEKIEQLQSLETLASVASHPVPPITPITRIPGALIHKKLIKFETPKVESSDLRESHNSSGDVFFTPNSTPTLSVSSDFDCDENSAEIGKRRLLVKQNLSGRFSKLQKPPLKECSRSIAFSRIENVTRDTVGGPVDDDDYDDDVFVEKDNETPIERKAKETKKQSKSHSVGGLWSIMSSVMGIPSRKGSVAKASSKNESSMLVDTNSIIKRCASVAGSLVRPKPLMDEEELQTLKRKRTFTMNEQSTSALLNQVNISEATSPNSDSLNTSSKRFRIQGRRPIDRMRFNS